MSDTTEQEPTTAQEPTTTEEPHGAEVDWKAESRKWEQRAKANKAAADELEQLKASQMSDTEKLVKRAEDAEALVKQYQAKEQHGADAAEVAADTGVPVSLLMHCGTREDMEQFAKEYAKETHVSSAPPAPNSRIVRGGEGKTSTRDLFTDFMTQNFR